jgi:uncharacterized protein YqjF (DUF2071 family)
MAKFRVRNGKGRGGSEFKSMEPWERALAKALNKAGLGLPYAKAHAKYVEMSSVKKAA